MGLPSMTEVCHCLHAFQRKACQHKGFCDRIAALELLQKMKPLPIADCAGCNDLKERLAATERELDRCKGTTRG